MAICCSFSGTRRVANLFHPHFPRSSHRQNTATYWGAQKLQQIAVCFICQQIICQQNFMSLVHATACMRVGRRESTRRTQRRACGSDIGRSTRRMRRRACESIAGERTCDVAFGPRCACKLAVKLKVHERWRLSQGRMSELAVTPRAHERADGRCKTRMRIDKCLRSMNYAQ